MHLSFFSLQIKGTIEVNLRFQHDFVLRWQSLFQFFPQFFTLKHSTVFHRDNFSYLHSDFHTEMLMSLVTVTDRQKHNSLRRSFTFLSIPRLSLHFV